MHHLFHNILALLTCFVSSLVNIVMFYVGLTMIDMIGVNLKNIIHFSQVSTMYERVYVKMGLFSLTQLISFSHSCWHVSPVINPK